MTVDDWAVTFGLCSFGLFLSAARDISRRWSQRRLRRLMQEDWRR